ncbi:tape measure protein [Hyphomicrobium sp.]|uniref:tape measure protein n=1 Tax=Hyphomicrobium sp. TaxID=82 RepID=UPI002FDDD960
MIEPNMAGEIERLLIRLEADTAQLRRALAQSGKEIGNFASRTNRKVSSTEKTFARLGASLKAALGGLAVGATIKAAGEMADAYTRMGNRLAVVTKSAGELEYVQRRLMEISQDARVGVGDTADLYSRYAFALKDAGVSTNEVLQFTEALSKAVVVSGASSAEAAGALLQLSQGLAAGVLRGQELNSVMEQMPIVADLIARKLGVTTGELKRMGEQGKITGDIVVDAVVGSLSELDERFRKTAPTIEQGLTQLNSKLLEFVGIADKSAGASAAIANEFDKMAEAIGNANQKWKDGASWWTWFKAWKGKDFSAAWDAAAGVDPMTNWQTEVRPGDFDPNAKGAKRTAAAPDPWAASIIPPTYDEQLREMKETWDEIRESQMLTLEDLVGDQMQTAEEKMRALNEAVRQGSIGWRDYGDMKETVDRQVERSQRALLSTTGQFLDSMFEGSKTAAIASALINTFEGVSKALTLLPPYSYAAASMTAAMGFAQVRAIQNTNKASKGGATATPSAASAQGATGAQGGAASVSRSLFVQGISSDQLYSGNQVAGIAEALLEFQRNGGQVVLDRRA